MRQKIRLAFVSMHKYELVDRCFGIITERKIIFKDAHVEANGDCRERCSQIHYSIPQWW